MTRVRSVWLFRLTALALLLSGCGDSGEAVWVTGRLLKGGQTYRAPAGQVVTITFVGLDLKDGAGRPIGEAQPFWADYDPSGGTFVVRGVESKGIPPGRYRISVTQKYTREAFDAAFARPKPGGPNRESDTLKDRFGLQTSPIVHEIPKSTDLTIDLDKPTGV